MDDQRATVNLTREQETLLITLYAKAGESALPGSLLNDTYAAEAVRRIDYDFSRLKVARKLMIGLAIRAHTLDTWTREFMAAHPGCTVLHLGCGLDTRVFRVDPPADVAWFDVDFPAVIDLRRQLYPDRPGYRLVGASVLEDGWLNEVPRDRPAMVVAEGLIMYLEVAEIQQLFQALTSHLPGGEAAFDAFSRLGVKLIGQQRSLRATGATLKGGIDDPHALEALVPGLRFVAEVPAYDPSQVHRFGRLTQWAFQLFLAVPALRRLGRFLRYQF